MLRKLTNCNLKFFKTGLFFYILILLYSCEENPDNLVHYPFKWVDFGNKFYYDYITKNDTLNEIAF